MTKRGKPNEKPENCGRIEVPSEPINPELLPGNVDQAEAERIISGLSPKWIEAPDLYQFSSYIQDLVNLAELGNSWRADELVKQHPRGAKRELIDDLKAVADAQIRSYAKSCEKEGRSVDLAAGAYLARHPNPLRRSRGRKASDQTAYETLKLAARVKLKIDKGHTVEVACELGDPNTSIASKALKAYYAFKDTPEIALMAALIKADGEYF
jgi:hypothetical protein